MPTPAEILRDQIPTIKEFSGEPKKYITAFGDGYIQNKARELAAEVGMPPNKVANISVKDGIISSPDFVTLKKMLGLQPPTQHMSEALEQALGNATVMTSIKKEMTSQIAKGEQRQTSLNEPLDAPSFNHLDQQIKTALNGNRSPITDAQQASGEAALPSIPMQTGSNQKTNSASLVG